MRLATVTTSSSGSVSERVVADGERSEEKGGDRGDKTAITPDGDQLCATRIAKGDRRSIGLLAGDALRRGRDRSCL